MGSPFTAAVLYFNTSKEEKWNLLIRQWLEKYRASGAKLELVVLTDPATEIDWKGRVCRVADHEEFCKSPLNRTGWLRANAFPTLGPCVTIDVDAEVRKPIDELAAIDSPIAMGEDPANRMYRGWPEASPEMNSGVMVFKDDYLEEYKRLFTEKFGHYGKIPYMEEMVYSAIWRTRGGYKLPREYNWSHQWGENPEAKIFHRHGQAKWEE